MIAVVPKLLYKIALLFMVYLRLKFFYFAIAMQFLHLDNEIVVNLNTFVYMT